MQSIDGKALARASKAATAIAGKDATSMSTLQSVKVSEDERGFQLTGTNLESWVQATIGGYDSNGQGNSVFIDRNVLSGSVKGLKDYTDAMVDSEFGVFRVGHSALSKSGILPEDWPTEPSSPA